MPILYSTVVLPSASDIIAFANSLASRWMQPDDILLEPAPASLVRHLWIGPISCRQENDLFYASDAWPFTLVHRILNMCTALRSLSIINLYAQLWYQLEGQVPRTVQALCLGPIHGRIDISELRCRDVLRSITSFDTYMADWEVHDIVTSPTIRRFCRFYSEPRKVQLAFEQLPCVSKATTLERIQIVCCDEDVRDAAQVLAHFADSHWCDDRRIVLTSKSGFFGLHRDGIGALYEDWAVGHGLD
ncbi:hypothetical protein A0H81_12647 [Grifola frondosa]|uniref:F-box domain-containing protein n=1 Tax=Grifola frondosa TaxID=5627 RepID=A0A1C7LRY2_GRIFR|nr:hypothetical protein A0H81_12647 [Grifola frondosa]